MKRLLMLLGIPLLVSSLAFPAMAETLRPFERIGRVGNGPAPIETTAPAPRLNVTPLVAVDDSWAGHSNGTIESVGMSSFTFGTDAFATVQDGIDAVDPGGTVKVLPGAYSETASGRVLFDSTGPYTFGIFVGNAKAGITIQGVDASGNPITSYGAALATINTNATNNFGPSGFFIEGDGCTIAGVVIGVNSAGQNKTIEVIGDDFTLNDCDVADVYGSVYINDWRFDVGLDTSHVQKYHITDCNFQHGVSIDLASGAGYSGSPANRVITGNAFLNIAGDYWPMISFNGSGTGVPWFVYSVGGAVITGNTFTNTDPTGQDIRARGTYDNSQFDWATYWSANTFDRAVTVGPAPPGNLRAYTYVSGPYTINNVRRIGAVIATGLDVAGVNDIVLVAAGTYPVTSTLMADVAGVTVQGAGIGSSILQVASAVGNIMQITGNGTTVRDVTIQKTDVFGEHNLIWINAPNVTIRNNEIFGPDPGTPWSVNGIVSRAMIVSGGATNLSIHDNTIHHLRQPCYITGGDGTIANNVVYSTRGWVLEGGFITFTGNSWGTGGNQNQGADIALLSGVSPLDYPDLLALSNANNNAFISAQFVGGANGRATGYVDDSAAPGGFGMSTTPYQTVSAGVGGTLPGGTVSVAAGSYEEQVIVNGKNLTIQGAGIGLTTVRSPLTLVVNHGTDRHGVIACLNASDIRVQGLTVDGLGRGNANYRMYGIGFWESGGKILNCRVTGIRETPLNGNQQGVGIASYNTTGGPFALEVGNCVLDDYQKNGMALSGAGMTVNVHDCTSTGSGNLAFQAQNGIQVSFGAAGSVTACRVSDMRYTPATDVASGILIYQTGGPVSVSGLTGANAIDEVQAPVSWYDGSGSMNGIEVTGTLTATKDFGPIYIQNSSTLLATHTASGRPDPQPMSEEGSGGQRPISQAPASMAYNVSVTNGCLTGLDVAGTTGVQAYSAGGPLSVSVTNSVIQDWAKGIEAIGAAVTLTANRNAITSNVIAGYDNAASGAAQNAEYNWWGHAGGPGVGGANPVVGAAVDSDPWLIAGTDTNPGCAFSPPADNIIAPTPPVVCLSATNTCLRIPVTITRTDSSPMRGFSVQVTLSPELALGSCSLPGGIVEGSYLNSVGGTNFQVLNPSVGVYTVDCAILGGSSCATAASGTLFTIDVVRTVSSGTGTVTVTPIKARDCVNVPILVSAGPPASVTIDAVTPGAITNLVAVQDKTVNGGSGRTAIDLSFTPSGNPAETTEIYRAKWGGYPEYDDAGFVAAPATPTYPPGGAWTLAVAQPANLGTYSDVPPDRDFWYYVAFTKDGCGNVSPVSNKTGGTLNYHLGDTHNGTSDCVGNNLVNSSDISFLGAHYGAAVPFGGGFNCLDVGPTTDFSVDKRPTTDNVVDFEDLIMFAINFGTVSKPVGPVRVDAAAANELSLRVPELPARGGLFEVALNLDGAGDIQGVSVDLAYNPLVVQPDAVVSGELLARQGLGSTVLSSKPGNVDVALLGVAQGIAGKGELARMAFRVVGDGDPGLGVKQVRARDGNNRTVTIGQRNEPISGVRPPVVNYLGANYPNPFMQTTVIPFGVKQAGPARLAVFDVQGRLVRGLLDGETSAGERVMTWDGRDDGGSPVASGLYLVRLEVGGQVMTRSLKLVK